MRLMILCLPLLAAACARQPVETFADRTPALHLEEFYNGHVRGYGTFFSGGGDVVKQFTIDDVGHWDGKILAVHEHYVYADGTTQELDWKFQKEPGGEWIGLSPDVVGEAHGREAGNAYRMHYTFDLTSSGSDHTLDFDDWQWAITAKVVMNRAWGTKLGLGFGEVEAVFVKD